jgi:P27 family predicted phage terminase small subunit
MRRKTAAMKKLQGTLQKSKEKARLQFVQTPGVEIRMPTYVRANKLAAKEWQAVAPFLINSRVLTPPDISCLASYCLLFSRWREASLDVQKNGLTITQMSQTRTGRTEKIVANPNCLLELRYQAAMQKASVKLGITPLDRSRVLAPEEEEHDPFDRHQNFLDGGEWDDDPDGELDYLGINPSKQVK